MVDLVVDTDLPVRIQKIYDSCSEVEQSYLLRILQEIAESPIGYSPTYEEIWLADFKEIPVDINTFLTSTTYLGKTNREGEAVYPFWKNALNEFFAAGNSYYEWVLTGATRIGKSSTAITATAYMLYRLMCLRDPQKFFNKKEVSKFSVLFFNVTKDLARGVAFREFNDTLKESPWFQAHGTFSDSVENFYYIPEGNKIEIDYGSDSAHGLGKQVFVAFMDECLVGNTAVVTNTGIHNIRDLEDSIAYVKQLNPQTCDTMYVPATIIRTKEVTDTIELTLEDGTIIEGTPEHPVMLTDGSYKLLKDITEADDIMEVIVHG